VRCAESCPTQALVFGDLDDPQSPISQMLAEKAGQVESYQPELGAKPAMKYVGLPKPFIAGEVVLADKRDTCPSGVKLTLRSKADKKALAASTDFLGDFEFKGLERNHDYTLRAEHEGYFPQELTVRTNTAQNVGEVVLQPK